MGTKSTLKNFEPYNRFFKDEGAKKIFDFLICLMKKITLCPVVLIYHLLHKVNIYFTHFSKTCTNLCQKTILFANREFVPVLAQICAKNNHCFWGGMVRLFEGQRTKCLNMTTCLFDSIFFFFA